MNEFTIVPAAPGTLALRVLDDEHCVRVTTVVAWRIICVPHNPRPEVYPVDMPYGPLEDRGLPDAIIEPDSRVTHRPGGGKRAQQAVEMYVGGRSVGLTVSQYRDEQAVKTLRRRFGL
ncbi:hypothetical protein [Burkholderia cenocepacia]|uniref:hypothetical protein n=1 Tax=Burkholderia cenocepacia TaxID=95486 RepID=UPI002ABE18AF|nr:hypothetical protein [Burkholderia cenocepacia]